MKPLLPCLLTLVAAGSLSAQIYADFTVSHGDTPLGTFRAELAWDKAPRPVAHFIGLATGQRPWIDNDTGLAHFNTPFYDGSHFQRLIHNFVIQGGDPPGKEGKRPGYVIQDQFHEDLRHDGRYFLSWAKASIPHSTGGQFFITLGRSNSMVELAKLKRLDDKHSIFGEVITGKNLIDDFADPDLFPTAEGTETPATRINLDSVVISGPSLASFDLNDPALRLPIVRRRPFTPSYDPATGVFAVDWDWEAQTDYVLSFGTSLGTLSRFRNILSLDDQGPSSYTLTGVTFPSFFASLVEVDYSPIPNAPTNLNGAGSVLTLTDRAGNSVTLTFDGADSGTWSDSLGNSGDLANVIWSDGRADTGWVQANPNFPFFRRTAAREIPIGGLQFDFDSPAGPSGWTTLGANVSFHEESSGFVEGIADVDGGEPEAVNQAFTLTP